MLSSIRSLLRPRNPRAEYEPIGEAASEGRSLGDREERKSFWAFWVLGAGVLLSWNGVCFRVGADPSPHLYDAATTILPSSWQHTIITLEYPRNSLHIWESRVPRPRSTECWQGRLAGDAANVRSPPLQPCTNL